MCRKEMEPIDDLPPASEQSGDEDDEDEEDEDEDEEELEITRAELDALLRSLGGIGITAAMGQRLFYEDEPTGITEVEFNNICMANGARIISSHEWELLLNKSTMQVTVNEDGERIVLSGAELLAVVKIQKVWRGALIRRSLRAAA
jgi:hypothetical protein